MQHLVSVPSSKPPAFAMHKMSSCLPVMYLQHVPKPMGINCPHFCGSVSWAAQLKSCHRE